MADAKSAILARIRRNLHVGADDHVRQQAVNERIKQHARGIIPERGQGGLETFRKMAAELDASSEILQHESQLPEAIARYLRAHNQPLSLRHGEAEIFAGLAGEALEIKKGKAEPSDTTGLSYAIAGVAETGTLLLISGPDNPTSLNFLPENHLVVLRASHIVASYEDALDMARAKGPLPRTLNFITGPSRTADVEQTIELGAHGPRRLHILIIQDGKDRL